MCGIAGLFRRIGITTPEDRRTVQRMTDLQRLRGPDGAGLYSDSHVVLGHRRLSIIDLSDAGRQPMANEDGTVWVTFNGEIYNFQDLQAELLTHGHHFRSKTDTEVLLHGYETWGIEGLLSRLRGMFAFAFHDARRSSAPQLILAKDRFGIKPLYYYHDGEKILFASEVQAIMRTGWVPEERNLEAMVRFLQLGSVPVPQTTIRNVLALPAGHYVTFGPATSRLQQYWGCSDYISNPDHQRSTADPDEAIVAIRAILDESVRLHLISDVPLGVFLSGGIDSSALVALASPFRDKPLTTLSVTFTEREYNEARYAWLVAKQYRTDHREVLLTSQNLFDELPRIFAAMDQPTVDGVNTYFVSKAAKQAGLTVVLSGTGGDEVFLGYPHFRKINSLAGSQGLLGGLPLWTRRSLIHLATRTGNLAGLSGLGKLAYLERPSSENLYMLFRGLFSPRQIQDLLGITAKEFEALDPISQLLDGSTDRSLMNSFIFFEFRHYLQNQLLRDMDSMSMANSIEARVPFLDHRLVEYVLGLPTHMKLGQNINKPLLVKSLGRDLLREIWDRPKMGFTFPIGKWIEEKSEDLHTAGLKSKLFNHKGVDRIWKGFRQGRYHWSRAWALVVMEQFESEMKRQYTQ